ncbi:MAG: ABC transporter permease [Bacteroidales bacterium]|nr:ABC transporter permease [Bacteroidales bacterium]
MIVSSIEALGRYIQLMTRVIRKPDKWSMFWRQFMHESRALIVDSIGIVCLISVFIGAVIVLQISINMGDAILPRTIIGFTAREILMLEFSSAVMCLILAGKIGSNISSEIGTMRITEQIDALEIMGVNSANYIILPKIVAMVCFTPILVVLSIATGLVGASIVTLFVQNPTPDAFFDGLQYNFDAYHITYSILKSMAFAFLIATISAFNGYYVKGGALQVGQAATRAVVVTSVLILLFDVILTNLLL